MHCRAVLHLGSCVISLCVTALAAYMMHRMLGSEASSERMQSCFVIYSTCLAIMYLFKTYTGIMMAEMRWTFIAVLSMIRSAVTSFAVYFWIDAESGVLFLAWANGLGFLLESVICWLVVRRQRAARVRLALYDTRLARELLRFGLTFCASVLGDSLRYRTQNYVIALFMGVRDVAIFSIAMQFISYFLTLMQSAFGFMVPHFSRLQARNQGKETQETMLQVLHHSLVMSSFIGLCLIFYGKTFILLWLGDGFAASYDALVPLTIGAIISCSMMPADGFLLGTAGHRILAVCALTEGGCIVLASLGGAALYGMGGVAWAYCLVALVFRGVIVPGIVFPRAGLPVTAYVRLLANVMLVYVTPQLLFYLALQGRTGDSYLSLVALAGVQAALVVVIQLSKIRFGKRDCEA